MILQVESRALNMTVIKSKKETDNSSARKGHCFSKILSLMGGTSAAAPAVWTMETQLDPLGVVPSLFLAVCICPEIHQSQGKKCLPCEHKFQQHTQIQYKIVYLFALKCHACKNGLQNDTVQIMSDTYMHQELQNLKISQHEDKPSIALLGQNSPTGGR